MEWKFFSATNKINECQNLKVSFLFEIHSSLTCINQSKYFFLCEQRTKHSSFFFNNIYKVLMIFNYKYHNTLFYSMKNCY